MPVCISHSTVHSLKKGGAYFDTPFRWTDSRARKAAIRPTRRQHQKTVYVKIVDSLCLILTGRRQTDRHKKVVYISALAAEVPLVLNAQSIAKDHLRAGLL